MQQANGAGSYPDSRGKEVSKKKVSRRMSELSKKLRKTREKRTQARGYSPASRRKEIQ